MKLFYDSFVHLLPCPGLERMSWFTRLRSLYRKVIGSATDCWTRYDAAGPVVLTSTASVSLEQAHWGRRNTCAKAPCESKLGVSSGQRAGAVGARGTLELTADSQWAASLHPLVSPGSLLPGKLATLPAYRRPIPSLVGS